MPSNLAGRTGHTRGFEWTERPLAAGGTKAVGQWPKKLLSAAELVIRGTGNEKLCKELSVAIVVQHAQHKRSNRRVCRGVTGVM